jgi:hypothetical protein
MTGRTAKGDLSRQRLIERGDRRHARLGPRRRRHQRDRPRRRRAERLDLPPVPGGKTQIACEALQDYSATVLAFIDASIVAAQGAPRPVESLFEAFARRFEASAAAAACARRLPSAADLADDASRCAPRRGRVRGWIDHLAGGFDFIADPNRARSFAGLVLSCIEGAYLRGRAEARARRFREAGRWLGELAAQAARARAPSRKR